ncbi:MAG: N-6 DNA methylase, partial [Lachnospiraceae bacterium]|nr:N-6 DNA methylase [Lachnospiraceae bacterium]
MERKIAAGDANSHGTDETDNRRRGRDMTLEREKQIKDCISHMIDRTCQQGQEIEFICDSLLFKCYFSLHYAVMAGEEFSFDKLVKWAGRSRATDGYYIKWTENFSHFLYLVSGNQEAGTLFEQELLFLENFSKKNTVDKSNLERKIKKNIRLLGELQLKPEEAQSLKEIILFCILKQEEKKKGCPQKLTECLAFLLSKENERIKLKNEEKTMAFWGSNIGVLPYQFINEKNLLLVEEETDQKKNALARMIYFSEEPEKRRVRKIEETKNTEIVQIGVSLWPFGTTREENTGYIPENCLPSLRGEYRKLGKWIFELSEDGVLYFLASAGFLYREGREKNLRRFLTQNKNLLDGIFLLPYKLWHAGFPKLVLLRFQKGRPADRPIYLL